jgi:hypothetical protein
LKPLAAAFRIASWLAAAAAGCVAAVLLFDALTGSLALRYRLLTLGFAAGFALIGLLVASLERALGQLLRHPANRAPELARPWRRVYLLLAVAAGLFCLLLASALYGIIERLGTGMSTFG